MDGEKKHFYQFKSFRLDVEERQLLHDNKAVPLTPKAFDVLVALVERNGHLVEKDELLKLVWADSFVEEANIARIVHTLRKLLEDDGNSNKFIETVAKKGYRFVAEVKEISESGAPKTANGKRDFSTAAEIIPETDIQIPPTEKDENIVPVGSKPKRRIRIVLFTVGFLSAVFLILLLSFNRQPKSSVNSNDSKSIAVLPLKPVNSENRDAIYELGITESIILKLNSAKGLKVRPLSAIRKYSDIEQDAISVGREQQVNYVLESNYQLVNGKIRVTSQLFNLQTGEIEETLQSEKESADKFLMQDAIANDIGNKFLAQFGKAANNLTAKRGTSNEEAYRLYLQAGFIFEEWDELKLDKAIEYLEQSVKLDPNFAPAQVDLAYAYQTYQFIWSKNITSDKEYYLKSKQAIEKALTLDENSADAHAVSGLIKSGSENDFAGAEKEYKRAIELVRPDSYLAHGLYAYYLMNAGRFDEALTERKKSIEMDPASVVDKIVYGMILYYARRYDEAAAHYKKMLEKDKNLYHPYFWLWNITNLQGNEPEAYEWFIKYQTQIKTPPEIIQLYQTAYQKSGTKGILREIIRQDEKIIATDKNPDLLYESACYSSLLGNKEKAFEYLGKAYEIRKSSLNFIKVDPALDSLHDDPRFEDLVRRVGLNYSSK